MSDVNGVEKEAALEPLEELLGYRFRNQALLARALTHSSYANEQADQDIKDNERLEFLGDAVLGLVISDLLFRHVGAAEGKLTLAKSHLVSGRNIRRAAEQYRLGKFLRLGRGEEADGGRRKASILANAFEAVIGAIYLDGGIRAAASFVRRSLKDALQNLDFKRLQRQDYKSYLQELLQAREIAPPGYYVSGITGPEHAKQFTVILKVDDNTLATGRGKSKKQAEQDAARAALDRIDSGELDLTLLTHEISGSD